MSIDWELEISKLVVVKQAIAEADEKKLWPHHFPRVGATEQDVSKLKILVDKEIPQQFLAFLKYANGWPGFYQTVDLLGTDDFFNQEINSYSTEILEQTVVAEDVKHNLLPIAVTKYDIDLFCLSLKTGEVYWYAGTEVEIFSDFNEYYLSMVDYNRRELSLLKSNSPSN